VAARAGRARRGRGDAHAALAEIARILRAGGRVAILDWRSDVVSPPGPLLEHRLPASAVGDEVRARGFVLVTEVNVGAYSYLAIAGRPKAGA
jgi:predicted methyltransferase